MAPPVKPVVAPKPVKPNRRPVKPNKNLAAAAAGNPIQHQAQAEIDPILAAIRAAALGSEHSSDAEIQALTNNYAKGIAGIDYGAPYSSGEAQQAAVDAALQQSATGQGSDLAAALSQRLQALQGSSGAGAVNQEAGALANQGAGIGSANLASGSAALNQLIADAAAAKDYGNKMPGVIRSAGLQGVEQAAGQAQQAINQGTQQAEAELPQIEQTLRADRLQAAANKQEAAYRNAELAISQQRANTSALQGQERINIEAQRAAQTAINENRNYRLGLSRLGVSQKSLQLRWLTSEAKLKGGGYTPSEAHRIQITANTIADDAGKHNASLQQLMHTMALNDVPPSIAFKAAKLAGYKPGKPGMFTGVARYLVGGSRRNGAGGGEANYGVTQGVGARVGQAVGGQLAQSSNAGGFLPKGAKFKYDRHDQGRDIQTRAGAPIIAPGDGYVVRIASDPGGGGAHFGPSYPVVYFTSGPYKGHYVYVGHTVAAMRAGQRFKAGAILSRTQRSGPMNGGAPDGWAEIGFAPGGSPGTFDQPAPF